MKRDYSKPIRDECRNCGAPSEEMRAGAPVWCVSPTCGVGFIPVFARIPEGERPATHELRTRDVTCSQSDDHEVITLAHRGPRRAFSAHDDMGRMIGWNLAQKRPWGIEWGRFVDEMADAVLWVAEGKRP